MAYDKKIRELRLKYGTTFNVAHTAANDASWTPGTATKIRAIDWEDNFEYASEPDPTLESQMDRHRANIPTLRRGKCSFKTFLEGGSATTTANTIATLLSKFFGGLSSPTTNKSVTSTGAGADATEIVSAGVDGYCTPGMAVLPGVRGDSRGNGEVRLINSETPNTLTLDMAMNAQLNGTSDVVVLSHTVFLSPSATQSYLDGLVIGQDATTNYPDQKQWVGGMGSVSLEGLGLGELGPSVKFDLEVGDWAHTRASQASLTPSSAHVGNGPAIDRGIGGLFVGLSSATDRKKIRAGGWSIDPGIKYVAIPDPNGVNGIGGFKRVRSDGVKWEFTALREEALGDSSGTAHDFYTAFTAGTAIQLMWQWGHAAQNCVAISMPLCYVDSVMEAELDGLSAVKVSGHATCGTSGTEILDSAMAIHFF